MAIDTSTKCFLLLLIVAITFCECSTRIPSREESPRSIFLRSQTVDTTQLKSLSVRAVLSRRDVRSDASTGNQYLIHFNENVKIEDYYGLLTRNDINVLYYIPHNTLLVYASPIAISSLYGVPQILWIGDYAAAHKVSPSLSDSISSLSPRVVQTSKLHVLLATPQDVDFLVSAWSAALEISTIRKVSDRKIAIQCLSSDLSAVVAFVSAQPQVHWIEEATQPRYANKYSTKILQDAQNQQDTKIWNKGITGTGQLIGVADSGLDVYHNFFYDPNVPAPMDGTVNYNHRKLVSYIPYVDSIDAEGGHGTFVCGNLAGNSLDSNITSFNGMAPDSKLVFVDIGNGTESIYLPDDLSQIYNWTYSLGAYIHSDSWGSSGDFYTTWTYEIDNFQWEHKDFLNVRAVGNDGQSGDRTVAPEANAKNSLVIGASMTTMQAFQDYYTSFVPYNEEKLCVLYGICNVTLEECCALDFYSAQYCCPGLAYNDTLETPYRYNQSNVAFFSSRGPAGDGRIKPDLLAPGYMITSSMANSPGKTSPHSDLFMGGGTSFSTPFTAGAIALIRQYFTDGYYANGTKGSGTALTPSASLLKAMAINSARKLDGYLISRNGSTDVQPIPSTTFFEGASYTQGYGLIQIDQVLRFDDSNFDLAITNEDQGLATGDSVSHCVTTSDDSTLHVTMVYTDAPGSPASFLNLINDLNLDVTVDDTRYPGNAMYTYEGIAEKNDYVNNVEEVTLSIASGKYVEIKVTANNVPIGPQPYSLVVRGNFQLTRCRECTPGESVACEIANGIGSKQCQADLFFTKCLVESCDAGYLVSSATNSCNSFLDLTYFVIYICGGIIGFALILLLVTVLCSPRLRKKRFVTGEPVKIIDLIALAERELPLLFVGAICGLVAIGASFLQPLYLGNAIEKLPTATSLNEFAELFVIISVLAAIEFVFTFLQGVILSITGFSISRHVRSMLFTAIMRKNFDFFDSHPPGELINRLSVDADTLKELLSQGLSNILLGSAKIIIGTVLLFVISWKLSLVFYAIIPFIAVIAYVYGKFVKNWMVRFYDSFAVTSSNAAEIIDNVKIIFYTSKQESERSRYLVAIQRFYKIAKKFAIISVLQDSASTLVTEIIAVVLLAYGFSMVINKEITQGLLLSFFLYIGYTAGGVTSFSGLYNSAKVGLGSSQRIMEIIKGGNYRSMKKSGKSLEKLRGEIEFQDVSFVYPSRPDVYALHQVNMKFGSLRTCAIVGGVGSGKSSITHLIMGLYKPRSGKILIDGVNLEDLDLGWLHTQITIVEQDPRLFNMSIADNISYAIPASTRKNIEKAAKKAHLHEFIKGLPQGYDTIIGEYGSNLSGGQRKQLAFARAILKNTRILILDEPTSGLDPESAQVVVRTIDNLAKRKTLIVIAHHLATIENAHKIFVLQKGEVAESGSHKQLMKKTEGLYSQLQQFSQLANTMRTVGWEDNNRSFESTMTSYADLSRNYRASTSATNLNLNNVTTALTGVSTATSDTEEEEMSDRGEVASEYETEQE